MKKLENLLEYPALAYSVARGLSYSLQFQALNSASFLLPGASKFARKIDPEIELLARREALALLKRDSENIGKGLYPVSVLKPESPLSHLLRLPRIFADGYSMYRRRVRGKTAVFDEDSREFLDDVPRYYRRNFHFQTGGYLSSESAALYEHQVEMLFGGAADAMRRLILAPLRQTFASNRDGKGLTFLEIGAGTGRATRFVRLAFPKAKIVALDLSEPYLKEAQKKLADLHRLDFVQADGAKLPFQDQEFDAVYSVFLYHELPLEERKKVLAESKRVLKKGGFIGLVDSLQHGDRSVFDELLERFPQQYHEPFYRNYLENSMQRLLSAEHFKNVKSDTGFFSKVCWAKA